MGLRWALVSLTGLGFASACSDDATGPGPGPGSTGGGGGESPATTAGTAGKPTTAGSGGSSAGKPATNAGEAGMGGTPNAATLGETCTACGATACVATLKTCNDSPECTAWLGCITTCDSSKCVTACDNTHADAAHLYTGVYECMCTSCKDACTGAGACAKKTCVDEHPLVPTNVIPPTLAETGLFATVEGAGGDGSGGAGGASGLDLAMPIVYASYVHAFEPKYPLWSDGAIKDRRVYIPKCASIDTADMDHWKFPVGTRFWKTFSVANKAVETRMLHHFGPGETDWLYAAYQWDEAKAGDPTAAVSVPAGVIAPGAGHDIPAQGQCINCHAKLSERVLGFGAIQLSHDANGADLTIRKISELGWLSKPAPDGFSVPGTAVQQAALGYLHGNCGGCHNQGQTIPSPDKPLIMRLLVGKKDYAMTDTVLTTLGITVVSGNSAITGMQRIHAMDPLHSALLLRLQDRGTPLQMPPLGTTSTKLPDTAGGIAAVTAWINSIAP